MQDNRLQQGGPDAPAARAETAESGRPLVRQLAANWLTLLMGGCVLAAVAIRAWNLSHRPLWVDEAFSVLYASIDWAEVIELRRTGTNPPLYHFLLSLWVDLFGTSAGAMRALSVAFGVGSLWLVYRLGKRLAGVRVACAATLLLAFSNLAVAYSREARFYALTQFLALLASLLVCRLIGRRRVGDAACYTLTMAALVWVHTYGWFVWAAHAVWLLAAWRDAPVEGGHRRRLTVLGAASLGLTVLLFLPWVPILREQVSTVLGGYWISEPTWPRLVACLEYMLVPERWLRWPLIVLAGAAAVGWLIYRRRPVTAAPSPVRSGDTHSGTSLQRCDLWGLAAWTALPILIPFLWSKVGTPIFQVKYAIVAQPALLILFAALLVRRPVMGLVVLALLVNLRPPGTDRGLIVEDFRSTAEIVVEEVAADEPAFIHRDYAWFALNEYLRGRRRVTPVYSEGVQANTFAGYYADEPVTFDEMMRRLADLPDQSVWFIARRSSAAGRDDLFARLTEHRDLGLHRELPGLDIVQLTRRGSL